MYARKWRCTCPPEHKEGFLAYLNETGIKESSSLPGFRGYQVMTRQANGAVQVSMTTYWDSMASIHAFAGDNIEAARLYPDDAYYEIQPDRHVTHYEVVQYHLS